MGFRDGGIGGLKFFEFFNLDTGGLVDWGIRGLGDLKIGGMGYRGIESLGYSRIGKGGV